MSVTTWHTDMLMSLVATMPGCEHHSLAGSPIVFELARRVCAAGGLIPQEIRPNVLRFWYWCPESLELCWEDHYRYPKWWAPAIAIATRN